MLYTSLAAVNFCFYTHVSAFSNQSIPYYTAYVAFQDSRNIPNTINEFSDFQYNAWGGVTR